MAIRHPLRRGRLASFRIDEEFVFGDSSGSATFKHNATDFSTVFNSTTDWDITGAELKVRAGSGLWVYDADNSDYMRMVHSGTWGHYGCINREGNGCVFSGSGSTATVGDHEIPNNLSLADDATGTLPTRRDRGIVILTSNGAIGTQAILVHTGTTMIVVYAGVDVAVGLSGSNPDTDLKLNIWKSSSLVFSIKNRLGSSLSFGISNFTG